MNFYLLQLVGKWISILFVSFISLFNINIYNEEKLEINNENNVKDLKVINNIIEYDTLVTYNNKIPNTVTNVIKEGTVGLIYVQETETNKIKETVIREPVAELVEKGTGPSGNFVGRLTGYGAGCPGCSKVANVACYTKSGKNHSLINDGIYYEDDQYGKVRILSAAAAKFPCGTIIEVTKNSKEPFYGVVLDRGGTMNSEWSKGRVHIDLAYESNSNVGTDGLLGYNISFKVKRWGW